MTVVKKIPIHERTIPAGGLLVVNGYGVNQYALKQRFSEGGYQLHQTDHFLLFTRPHKPAVILVHTFAPEEINSDIHHYLVRELQPLGVVKQPYQFGEILAGIIGSLYPDNIQRAWRFYGTNTLQRLLSFLATAYTTPSQLTYFGTIGMFATLYQRICELRVGDTFLDAGCATGFLPLLLAERIPFLHDIVGIDIQHDVFQIAATLAGERQFTNVRFIQADLLAKDFRTIGQFDTVVALHVLEHLSEQDMYLALPNLLDVTLKRLIIAVPYDGTVPEAAYGHLQLFTREKLEGVGAWCIQQLGGAGRLWCEDCVGGLLLVERTA